MTEAVNRSRWVHRLFDVSVLRLRCISDSGYGKVIAGGV